MALIVPGGHFRQGSAMKLLYAPDTADHPNWGCRFMGDWYRQALVDLDGVRDAINDAREEALIRQQGREAAAEQD